MDAGTIVMIVVLAIFPVVMLMSMAGLAGILGWVIKTDADDRAEGSELLALSDANPWAGPATEEA